MIRPLLRVLCLLRPPISLAQRNRATSAMPSGDLYRADGVRITHDPYAPGMAEKYGRPGQTDNEGFDPYADSVGAGIYGGVVKRDDGGEVVIGQQYQNHNPRPGPIYAGGGYAPCSEALADVQGKLIPLLAKFPDLVNDVTTGGAQPLHMCGMSGRNEAAVDTLMRFGADLEAVDTYGFRPIHRMASNNLAAGATSLLRAGADPSGGGPNGPLGVAQSARAQEVLRVLKNHKYESQGTSRITAIHVMNPGEASVAGLYFARPSTVIPTGFATVCQAQQWNTVETWGKLNGKSNWFLHEGGESYVYYNQGDRKWWIDAPDGGGVYLAAAPSHAPPGAPSAWQKLRNSAAPTVRTFRLGYEPLGLGSEQPAKIKANWDTYFSAKEGEL
jgi:hypothetical protein